MPGGRLGVHLLLAAVSIAVAALAPLFLRAGSVVQALTIGLGYLSLVLIAATLLVGPLALRSRPRNPVNVYLRRDLGIWAAITGLVHVLFGLQVHLNGEVLRYFFRSEPREHYYVVGEEERYFVVEWLTATPLADLFGIANWIGLAASVVLLLLLLLSNDLSLRTLRGPLWKTLQRCNYLLVSLVLIHTFAYQAVVDREAPFVGLTLLLALVVLLAQLAGVALYRRAFRGTSGNRSG